MAKDFRSMVPQIFLTRQEAADLLRVEPTTIDKWANDKIISRFQIRIPGNTHYFPRFLTEELLDLVKDWQPGEFGRGGLPRNPRSKK